MKKYAAFLTLLVSLIWNSIFAQTNLRLKLSNDMPRAGEKISLSYDPTGTALAGKKIRCDVHFLDGKDYPVDEVALKPDGSLLKGQFTVLVTAQAFFVRIGGPDTTVDNNGQKGYTYLVYKGNKPVEGAYAALGAILSNGRGQGLAKIKTDRPAALNLYKKEYELYPKNDKDLLSYVTLLNTSKNPADVVLAKQLIADLAETGIEKNMIIAREFYMNTRMWGMVDSLGAVINARFPDGVMAQTNTALAVDHEKDLAKKEQLYLAYAKRYPETDEKKTPQENMRLQLATAYLEKGDLENYHRFENLMKDKTALAAKLNTVAYKWAQNNERLNEAEELSKQSIAIATEMINGPASPYNTVSGSKMINQRYYNAYTDTYAYILYRQGKFDEALKTEQTLFAGKNQPGFEMTAHYVAILRATGDNKKAAALIETAIKGNNSTAILSNELKELYIKEKGSADGFDTYFAALKDTANQKLKVKLAKTMISQAAPDVTLKDIDGNTVSLTQFKGKVLVVDFFSAMCIMCNTPLPGMQLAVNKFANVPGVDFLFIDAWAAATGNNYLPLVKKFITDNKYNFHVLLDERGSDGSNSRSLNAFGVTGIPALIVIDPNGKTRFKTVGSSASADATLNEVSAMIEMALHPETVTTDGKTLPNGKN